MRLSSLAAAGLAGLALGGCASSSSQSPNAAAAPATPAPAATSAAASGAGGTAAVRWSGSFAPTQQRSGDMGGSDRARTYGSVTLEMSPTDRNRTRARISLTVPATANNTSLPWAIHPGRCGSGSVPVMSVNLFPPMEVGGNGRAEINSELAFSIPATGSFHVNVYWAGGSTLENVMTCSNLRRDG